MRVCMLMILAGAVLGCRADFGPSMHAPDFAPNYARQHNDMFSYIPSTVEQHTFGRVAAYSHPDLSADGRRMVYAATVDSARAGIYIQEIGTGAARVVAAHPMDDITPALSPDGRRVAFASNRTGWWNIYIASLDTNEPLLQITDDSWEDFAPTFSPDGRNLAFSTRAHRASPWRIVMIDLKTGVRTHLTDGLWPRYSPSGESIAFVRPGNDRRRESSLWTVSPDGANLTQVYRSENHGVITPAWAGPDWLLFGTLGRVDGNFQVGFYAADDIWIVRLDGTQVARVTWHGGQHWYPVYDHAGRRCFFVGVRDNTQNLYSASLDLPRRPGETPVLAGGQGD
jgi:TolB protein